MNTFLGIWLEEIYKDYYFSLEIIEIIISIYPIL